MIKLIYMLVSKATKNNWKRLNLNAQDIEKKLTKRANKRYSKKLFIPKEYSTDVSNVELITDIVEKTIDLRECIYYLAVNLLNINGLSTTTKYIYEVLEEFEPKSDKNAQFYLSLKLPTDEKDFLGCVYQSLLNEGSKNIKGSYYTPQSILEEIFPNNIDSSSTFLDPCCGTGSFLLEAANSITSPEQIFGCDMDEVACFIAKINLIIKFKDKEFRPNIFNMDFLGVNNLGNFDIIATNPPWGALSKPDYKKKYPQITSDESFSYFIAECSKHLNHGGKMLFVLPESVLNVKVHSDIRKFILDNFQIEKINLFGRVFSKVLTGVVSLSLRERGETQEDIIIGTNRISQSFFEGNTNYNFSVLDNYDVQLLDKIYSKPYLTLKDSVWALGIVTGDNSRFISENQKNGEKIYSGKNISKDGISDSARYILYDRTQFQQVASGGIYRAKEKLVYKFISKKLVFAYDDKQRLFLNSANILIPKLDGYSIKDVMTFLNSTLFQYIYSKKFNELKVLKGNLLELPFPVKCPDNDLTDDKIFELYDLTNDEISYIKNTVFKL